MLKKIPIQPYKKVHYKYTKEKKSYTPVMAVIILIVIWYLFIGRDVLSQLSQQATNSTQVKEKVYYNFPCSEANLARILSIALVSDDNTSSESKGAENASKNTKNNELEDTLWYEKYYSNLESLGITTLQMENAFNLLSSKQLEAVLKEITSTPIAIEAKNQLQLYEVLEYCQTILEEKNSPITYKSLTLLATPTDHQDLSSWEALTTDGKLNFEGLVVDPLKNKTIQVACIGEALLGVMEIESEECYLEECKILALDDQKVSVEVLGTTLSYENTTLKIDDVGSTGSLVVKDGQIIEFIKKNSVQEEKSKAIRVLLSSGTAHYYQEDVSLSASENYDLIFNDKTNTLVAGESWKASNFNWEGVETIKFVPKTNESQITIESIEKSGSHPSYFGTIEITKSDSGYRLINEVNIERYVAGVLPSEMPTSYGLEALKAQAIAIRTYGFACIESGRFMDYGAHVDDTTASQVYNRVPTDDLATSAANQTAGLVLKYDGKLISNKFFATSCGYTANYGEVWAGQDFPSQTPSYLVASKQYLGDQIVKDLSQEEDFKAFITLGAEDLEAFDEASPWFRWKVNLTKEALEKLVKPALTQLSSSYGTLITYQTKEGIKQEGALSELGDICHLEVVERGKGGNAMSLKLEFSQGQVIVETEYLIRSLFASNENQGLSVDRNNGTTSNQMNLLPSAFFMIEEENNADGTLKQVRLIGGGNGHGVGLSQDGAKGMSERGYTYDKILQHYYRNCEITR